jgi:putative flippase GtrA
MRRIIYFLIVGALVCGVDFGMLSVLKRLLPAMAAVSIAYFTAVATHYALNKWWVFGSRHPVRIGELARYVVTVVACWICTVGIVWLMLRAFTSNIFVAKLAALPPTTLVSFVLMRTFVFAHHAVRPRPGSSSRP